MRSKLENNDVLKTLEYFTMPLSSNYKKERKNYKYITNGKFDYLYDDGNIKINFYRLSDCFHNDLVVQDLQSSNRYYGLSNSNLYLANFFKNSKLCVGFIKNAGELYLHSWLEINDEKRVADYTKNLIVDKDNYYLLTGAEVILKFDGNDISKYKDIFNNYPELNGSLKSPVLETNKEEVKKILCLSKNK